ncbi:MAG TPA: sugar phosphate isomerase/epimerase [Phycisphaerae bacterium]|nr:sugar phosphate isomerase/epimerase [Phycisphaerae bacterium]
MLCGSIPTNEQETTMAELKLSAACWCFNSEGTDPAELFGGLAEAGYTAAEMVGEDNYDTARAAGLELLNECAPGMGEGLNFLENHDELIPQIRETIRLAGENGVAQVIVFSGAKKGLDDETGIANCVAGLEKLIPDVEASNIVLTLEMLCIANHGDYHATASAFGYEVVRRVGSPHVKALYDIYHQARTGEDLMATLVPNLDLVAHLHVAGSPQRDFPGPDQEIDYRPLVQAVQAAGYDGYWGMEFMPHETPLQQAIDAAELFRSYAAAPA